MGTTSPARICCGSGMVCLALGRPRLSSRSYAYQPALPKPICTIQGQMRPGGAFTVTALVALNVGRATISSHGGADVAMTIGALGYLAAFGDMNLLSARV